VQGPTFVLGAAFELLVVDRMWGLGVLAVVGVGLLLGVEDVVEVRVAARFRHDAGVPRGGSVHSRPGASGIPCTAETGGGSPPEDRFGSGAAVSELLSGMDGAIPADHKFFVFHGRWAFVQVMPCATPGTGAFDLDRTP